ncbi:hypothetical protein [Sphingobium naphthae]|uniref:Uncharacterized protein n=1 Tax=Sphingobium naphthae TaxID=1886786 RepID=A0ABU3ZRG0_9SPHN|nr:hypothetical protein [Sphingobium naphthae]MDV5822113.1 hypothetical protein [Sphingobium naphthae]
MVDLPCCIAAEHHVGAMHPNLLPCAGGLKADPKWIGIAMNGIGRQKALGAALVEKDRQSALCCRQDAGF